jgi:serine/threonine-protein kinase
VGTQATRPATQFGPWQVVRQVAEGQLSRVYQARPVDGSAGRPAAYAVKVLMERWYDDAAATETVRREATAGRQVSHPHLISVLAAQVDGPPYYVVTPWLAGETLAAALAAGRCPSLAAALWFARQAAEALGALDASGWMHGDVKPSNLFVCANGHLTLLDLGFARRPDESGSAVDRCVAGTFHYIAPETVTSAMRSDIRSDMYSLGVTLYELLTGRLPFEGRSLAELAEQHRQGRPRPIRSLVPGLPLVVARLVHRLMAKEPLRRPQTPGELVERLFGLEIATFAERW